MVLVLLRALAGLYAAEAFDNIETFDVVERDPFTFQRFHETFSKDLPQVPAQRSPPRRLGG